MVTPGGLDHYVDDLFSPVLHQDSRTPVSPLMFSFILCSSPLPMTPSGHPLCLCSAQTCLWMAFYWEVCLSELRQCCFFLDAGFGQQGKPDQAHEGRWEDRTHTERNLSFHRSVRGGGQLETRVDKLQ